MKSFMSKFRLLLISCLAIVAIALGALSFIANDKVTADAAGVSLSNGEYSTDGSSMRIFKTADDVEATERTGLRFHVEMGDGYLYNGNPVINTSETNADNGSYKINDGFVTYTLIIPTRLLDGELSVNTPNVLKLNTSNFWYHDKDNNLESVAYIYNIPNHRYTDMFSFRGVVCDSNGNLLAQTSVVERCVAEIARKSYDATNAGTEDWGSTERTQAALDTLLGFIPVFDVIYQDVNGNEIATESVMWGDAPTIVPTSESFNAWYDTNNSTEVDVSKAMHYPNGQVILTATKAEEFNLTGVAAKADFEVDSNKYHGVKVFATLHREAFTNKTPMDTRAVNIEHKRGDEILYDGIELQGVWTMEEQNSLGEWQMLLFFALDTSKLQTGDDVIIKGDSVFYANGVMYKLTEDYTIDYTKTGETEDYGMYLGDLYNSDVKAITNCSEDNTGNEGAPNEFTIRVEFYEDVMINGEFTFEFGPDSDTSKYQYPVYIKCGADTTKLIPIAGGRYYWNEGDHKILELIGAGDYANKVFGWHKSDELIGAPGTIIKQNGGYYIFKDEMYAYFLTNGNVDKWGYALGDWVVGDEIGEFTTSEFATEGSVAETTDYGSLADEIRINTTNHWFGETKVSILTTEKMLDSAPYAVYVTSKDGTVTEIDRIRYHGQGKPEGGNYQILGLCGDGKFTAGDIVTIAEGTRFWLGAEYYTVTEEITYYYNGNYWVQNYDESTMGELSSASFGDRAHNQGSTEMRMYFTAPLAGYTTNNQGAFDELRIGIGSITFNGNPVSYVRYQRWDEGSTWLSLGGYAGSNTFGDKVVIEAGTTIWGAGTVAYKFTEKVEWIYSGNPADANRNWSRVIGDVTVSATAENASVTGAGTFAVGETYTVNVTPTGDYLVSKVTINDKELSLNESNVYTFTVEQNNTINVETVAGHKVYFTIPEGITVDGGALSNGSFKSVADGGTLTFSVSANEGYKLLGVSGATDNGNGTYTVSNVTSNMTVSISVEKLYRVTYSGSNATVTANVASGAYVENGTQITVTAKADDGYTVIGATNATKVTKTTYTATVNGADLNINVSTMETGSFIKATSIIGIEDRTSWASGGHADIVTFGLMDFSITEGNQYFKSSVSGCWYKGNADIITANNGIDILEYVYLNGVSARELLNANTGKSTANTGYWLSNPAAWPIAFETGTDCWIRIDKTAFDGGNFTFTLKAGFSLIRNDGAVCVVTNDIHYTYANGTLSSRTVDAPEYTVNFDNADKVTVSVNSSAISNGAKVAEDTETTISSSNPLYKVYTVTVNGTAVAVNNGICTFTLEDNVTIAITVLEVSTIDITDRIQIEDRAWGAHSNEVYVGVLDNGVTYTVTNDKGEVSENHYFNTSVNGTWYVGNNDIIAQNGGLDIMEYIYVNGVSARSLITSNQGGKNDCNCWLSNPAAYPVYVETTEGSGLMMRFATAKFGTEFTITIKAGFRITDAKGNVVIVTKDINFTYNNGTITKTVTQ